MKRRRNVYIAIMKAAALGRGLHLTADEVGDLSLDDAISSLASNDLPDQERDRATDAIGMFEWGRVNVLDPSP